jgi:small-conductance mechanosensitive channel
MDPTSLIDPTGTASSVLESFERDLFNLGGTAVSLVDIAVALAVLALFALLARYLRKGLERLLRDRLRGRPGVAHAIGRIAQYVVVAVGVVVALDQIGVHLGAVAATGAIVAVGIGIGLQDITKNILSGVLLLLERHVQKDDFVIVGDTVGTVQSIELRATRVVSRDGVSIIVPNSELVSGVVINQSQPTPVFRTRVAVGVAYGSDTELVRETLLEVADAHPRVRKAPPPTVFFRAFGSSSLDFELAVWIDDPQPEPAVTSDLRFAIDAAFRERGVTIAFPQLDLHVIDGLEALAPRPFRGREAPRGDGQGDRGPRTEGEEGRPRPVSVAPAPRTTPARERREPVPAVRDTTAAEKKAVEDAVRAADDPDGREGRARRPRRPSDRPPDEREPGQ